MPDSIPLRIRFFALASLALLAACQSGGSEPGVPGETSDSRPFAQIAPDEELRLTGTEPFWGGTVSGTTLTYTTPENIDGEQVEVERFAGRGGLSFSGTLAGKALDMTVTPGDCSDAMSDRTYPFVVTLRIGEDVRNGCAWSEAHPFEGLENP